MKTTINILKDLNDNGWNINNKNPFIEKVLFPALEDVLNEDEMVMSQIWGVRIDDSGRPTSKYDLITLTDKRIISLYSDLSNQNDKIRINSQSIKNIHKVNIDESMAHPGNLRVDIYLKGYEWSLETDQEETTKHFGEQLKKLQTIKKEQQPETDQEEKTSDKSKTFINFVLKGKKKILLNDTLWVFVSAILAIAVLITASVMVTGSKAYVESSAIPAGAFEIIFAFFGAASMVLLSIIYWDDKKFSIDLYRSLLSFFLYLLFFVFGILTASRNTYSVVWNAIMIVMSIIIMFDSIYTSVKSYYNYFAN